MTKLKLASVVDDKPVKVTLEFPAVLHRDLTDYARVLASEAGQPTLDPIKLVIPMLERFIATDRGFARARDRLELKALLVAAWPDAAEHLPRFL